MKDRISPLLLWLLPLFLLPSTQALSQVWHRAETAAYYEHLFSDGDRIHADREVSDDRGRCWSTFLPWMQQLLFTQLESTPTYAAHDDTVLVGFMTMRLIREHPKAFRFKGMYRVTDSGRRLEKLPLSYGTHAVRHMGGSCYIAAVTRGPEDYNTHVQLVTRTTDGGDTWHSAEGDAVQGHPPLYYHTDNYAASDGRGNAIICLQNSSTQMGGVFISTDSGATWKRTVQYRAGRAAAVLDAGRFAMADTIVRISQDGGDRWLAYHAPWPLGDINALSFADKWTLLVGADSGLFRVSVLAQNWRRVELPYLPRDEFGLWGIDEILVHDGVWLVRTGGLDGLLYRSEDEGGTWHLPDCTNEIPTSFVRTADGHVLATARSVLGYKTEVVRNDTVEIPYTSTKSSESNGEIWNDRRAWDYFTKNAADGGFMPALRMAEVGDGGVVGAFGQGYGIGYLPPYGESWIFVTHDLDQSPDQHMKSVTGLSDGTWFAYDDQGRSYHGYCRGPDDIGWEIREPKIESAVLLEPARYVGYGGGVVYGTNDGGTTWEELSRPEEAIGSLAAFADGNLVLLTAGGVRLSTDGGRSWSTERALSSAGLTVSSDAHLLVAEPGTILVGADSAVGDTTEHYGGLFRSDDRGETWYRWEDGLGSRRIQALGRGFKGRILVAAGRSVYYTDMLSSVGEQSAPGATAETIPIVQARYDNDGMIRVEWRAHRDESYSGSVYATDGRIVRRFTSTGAGTGWRRTEIPVADVTSGVYLVRVCGDERPCGIAKVAVVR